MHLTTQAARTLGDEGKWFVADIAQPPSDVQIVRFNGLCGAARPAELVGDREKAETQ